MKPDQCSLKSIKEAIGEYSPSLADMRNNQHAAVSLVLRDGADGSEILFIERAQRIGDPWSGEMAFPGGRRNEEDATPHDTAERETFEEIGIRLPRSSCIGRIDDLIGQSPSPAPGLVISCLVYELLGPVSIFMNHEVQDVVWLPVASLASDKLFVERFKPKKYVGEFPGIRCGEGDSRTIWGLTYRFLCVFFQVANIPFTAGQEEIPSRPLSDCP